MRELLADEMSRFPEDDARLLELRRQIGELEVGGDVGKEATGQEFAKETVDRVFELSQGQPCAPPLSTTTRAATCGGWMVDMLADAFRW
ncbi:hypothetical protein [Nonomuraea sp. NPDC049750]|uniref:hypothetical protein n=1 Tax=Nonomuraea sp. NPDC049750 TaxID=3154738 RepID=UPI00340966C0